MKDIKKTHQYLESINKKPHVLFNLTLKLSVKV